MLKNYLRKMSTKDNFSFIPRYYDVGLNITDSMFNGDYHNRNHHRNDTIDVLEKAYRHHVQDILLTGSSLSESKRTIEIITSLKNNNEIKIPNLYSTVGVHPCTVLEFESSSQKSVENHLQELQELINFGINLNIVKAFGEIGLDYDRLHYTPKEKQLLYFEKQLHLATNFGLPLFLHMRAACADFIKILEPFLKENLFKNKNLLVHSFTGNKIELENLLNLENLYNYNVYISINGASLRDTQTLEILNLIPLNRLMIETDSPWCEIKKSHPSWKYLSKSPNPFYPDDLENYNIQTQIPEVAKILQDSSKNKKNSQSSNLTLFEFLPIPIVKSDKFDNFKYSKIFHDSPLIKSRNEPCLIGLVAQVISKVTNTDPELIVNSCYQNSKKVFG
jgi:TatD DNase family protein